VGESHKPSGIKDIAKALGVSIGTVDRALHGRPGVNPITRTRVLRMAKELDYHPNVAARNLKLRKKIVISVLLPEEIASFYDVLREGIREAARPFESTIELQFRSYPRLGEGDAALFEQALEQGANGIILAPGRPDALKTLIRRAARNQVPVVCVTTDAPGTERLATVSSDAYTSGSMVAELLSRCLPRGGEVVIVTGDLGTYDHAEKVRGFREMLERMMSGLSVAEVIEAHDEPELAYRMTGESLARRPELSAVYVSTANSMPVVRALEERGVLGQVTVMTTDLFPTLVPLIRSGKVMGTVYQRPRAQGRMAFQALYQFLVEGNCPQVRHRVPPHIILRSNLDLFLEILPGDFEEAVGPLEGVEGDREG
jgi:LacI family transcriptional regulator